MCVQPMAEQRCPEACRSAGAAQDLGGSGGAARPGWRGRNPKHMPRRHQRLPQGACTTSSSFRRERCTLPPRADPGHRSFQNRRRSLEGPGTSAGDAASPETTHSGAVRIEPSDVHIHKARVCQNDLQHAEARRHRNSLALRPPQQSAWAALPIYLEGFTGVHSELHGQHSCIRERSCGF